MANKVDDFYPLSTTMIGQSKIWELGLLFKIESHLKNAKNDGKVYESKLINRLGQLRRNIPELNKCSPDLQVAVKEAADWLRTQGRKIDFQNPNPGLWISARDGKSPRF